MACGGSNDAMRTHNVRTRGESSAADEIDAAASKGSKNDTENAKEVKLDDADKAADAKANVSSTKTDKTDKALQKTKRKLEGDRYKKLGGDYRKIYSVQSVLRALFELKGFLHSVVKREMQWIIDDLEDEISYNELKQALQEGGSMGLSAAQVEQMEREKRADATQITTPAYDKAVKSIQSTVERDDLDKQIRRNRRAVRIAARHLFNDHDDHDTLMSSARESHEHGEDSDSAQSHMIGDEDSNASTHADSYGSSSDTDFSKDDSDDDNKGNITSTDSSTSINVNQAKSVLLTKLNTSLGSSTSQVARARAAVRNLIEDGTQDFNKRSLSVNSFDVSVVNTDKLKWVFERIDTTCPVRVPSLNESAHKIVENDRRVHVPLNKHSYARALLTSDVHLIKLEAGARSIYQIRNLIMENNWPAAYHRMVMYLSTDIAKAHYPMSKISKNSAFKDVLQCVYNRMCVLYMDIRNSTGLPLYTMTIIFNTEWCIL